MAEIFHHAVPGDWTREEKLRYLAKTGSAGAVVWTKIAPNKRHQWLTGDLELEFDGFLPIGSKEAKQSASSPAVFRTYCRGVCSNNDAYVYSFDREALTARALDRQVSCWPPIPFRPRARLKGEEETARTRLVWRDRDRRHQFRCIANTIA